MEVANEVEAPNWVLRKVQIQSGIEGSSSEENSGLILQDSLRSEV
jgi:hypothetical protein